MSLDILALSSTFGLLVINFAFVLYMGTNNLGRDFIRIDAKDVERRATERLLRRNLGLPESG